MGVLNNILASVQENFGKPVKLASMLADNTGAKVDLGALEPSIDAHSVIPWHNIGHALYSRWPLQQHGTLMGWSMQGGHYQSFTVQRREVMQIGLCETSNWSGDISEIAGFAAGKSNLRDFTSTDAMVEKNSPELIDTITPEKLAENLAHREIRIIHAPGCDYFERYAWDGRLFLMNSGGLHHCAAAKYIAMRLNQPVPLSGTLYTYSLDPRPIAKLRDEFEIFALSDDHHTTNEFFNAMASLRATWLWHPLPKPFENAKAILLPKNERRSMRAAAALHEAGIEDLGAHIAAIAKGNLHIEG